MINKGQNDKDLIERYVAGDKSALAILVKRWHKTFCEKAFWVIRDKDLAKDMAQECWIVIINKLHTLKNTDSFKSWALRIVYTKAIDAHKRRAVEIQDANRVEGQLDSESEDIEAKEVKKAKLLGAIKDLSSDKQDIIRLFYLEEYSIKEISSFLQIPAGTVKSRLFKARKKLKSILKK